MVGNPACCCTLDLLRSEQKADGTSYCCCTSQDDSGSEKDPAPPHRCACELSPADITEPNLTLPEKPSLAGRIKEAESSLTPRAAHPAIQVRGPNTLPPDPSPPHLSFYQVFRL